MDFALSDEQEMLRDTTRDILGRSYDVETRNKTIATELGWSRKVWATLAEIGLLGLEFSEDDGGMGAGPVETMAVLTEVGRRLAPEPITDAVLIPGGLIASLGSAAQKELLGSVVAGQTLLAFAHAEPGARWPDVAGTTTANADGTSITGVKNPVLRGDCADHYVVSAQLSSGGTGLFLVAADAEGVARTGYATYDGLRAAQVQFDNAPAVALGSGGDASEAISRAIVAAQAALCAEAVGAMEEALRLTAEYLTTRKQFGVTLSKFQTLTQRAADMYVSLELARSMSIYATLSLADGNFDPVIASRAKLQVGRSAKHIGEEAIQLHGGIGMTAEHPVGHYVARLTAINQTWGAPDDHARVLSANVGNYARVEL